MVLVKIDKKNIAFIVGGALLLLLGFFIGRKGNRGPRTLPLPLTPTPTLTSTPAPSPTPTLEVFKVTRVIDGDTIEIEGEERVRYIGIDTPETVDPRKPVQCFGVEASKKNKELVEGKTVRLEKDITNRDKYGRLLRYVYIDSSTGHSTLREEPSGSDSKSSGQMLFVNLELVKQGFATSYTYPPDVKHQAEILAAEKEAREANRGLWVACPLTSPTIPSQETPGDDCDIKGNINASGEKIYHLPGCGSYAKTKIDESRGERWFCSQEEAQDAGWRRALNCP